MCFRNRTSIQLTEFWLAESNDQNSRENSHKKICVLRGQIQQTLNFHTVFFLATTESPGYLNQRSSVFIMRTEAHYLQLNFFFSVQNTAVLVFSQKMAYELSAVPLLYLKSSTLLQNITFSHFSLIFRQCRSSQIFFETNTIQIVHKKETLMRGI